MAISIVPDANWRTFSTKSRLAGTAKWVFNAAASSQYSRKTRVH
jgi:hypothetical protein